MHHVVLCADDFGLTEGVSRGIVDLARRGRLSATSVMAHRPGWQAHAADLAGLGGRFGIGLHLTLSLGRPLGTMRRFAPDGTFPPFPALLRSSLRRQTPADEIREEIDRQLSALESALGRPPDFVDGHQHVHVLPGVREPLLAALAARGWSGRLWLRDPSDRLGAILRRRVATPKALLVAMLARGFGAAARRAGFDVNDGFSGFSSFDPGRDVGTDFARFFQELGPRQVVMCHPGHVDPALHELDPVIETRVREYDYLVSDAFPALLKERAISLVSRPS
jgi:predicted glycoside hydrolase/deacetylase ChbG (UPF0249 family)